MVDGGDPPLTRPARGGAGRSSYGRRCGYEVRRSEEYRGATSSSLKRSGKGSSVGEEAPAGLASQGAGGDQLAYARGNLDRQRLADRRRHVEPHPVEQRQRPEGVTRPDLP